MVQRFLSLTMIHLYFFPSLALAAPLFEGWYKINSGGVHVGYFVSRYEFDEKAKQFKATVFLNTGALGSSVTESIKASADENLNPVAYSYTAIAGKDLKTIDAKFKNNRMTAVVTEKKGDGKPITKNIINDIKKGIFLSYFQIYVVLKSPTGLKANSVYSYEAIAEEDASLEKGEAKVGSEETKNGVRAYRIENKFKGMTFVSWVTERGEVLSTESKETQISTELVARVDDAVGQFSKNTTLLKSLFGDVPTGTENIIAKKLKESVLNPPPPASKKEGVPQGQGILLKSGEKEK